MFRLALPWVMLLLPLPWLMQRLVVAKVNNLASAIKVPCYAEMSAFNTKKNSNRSGKFTYFFLVWVLLLLAAAGPQWVSPLSQVPKGRNIMLVLDISGSMELDDMIVNGQAVTRLDVIKHTAKQFIKQRDTDKIGLILFGSQAYLQTPLTYDRSNLLMRLSDTSVGLAGKTTSIGDALGLAVKKFRELPKDSRIVILLTDGANNSGVIAPLKAAELAKEAAIKVYTIGLGSQVSAFNSGPFLNASADLDENTLIKIATLTKGSYFRATDLNTLETVYQTIDRLEAVKQSPVTINLKKEYYVWPLALAFGLITLFMLYPWLMLFSDFLRQWVIKT